MLLKGSAGNVRGRDHLTLWNAELQKEWRIAMAIGDRGNSLLPNDLILFTPVECDLSQGFRAEGKPA